MLLELFYFRSLSNESRQYSFSMHICDIQNTIKFLIFEPQFLTDHQFHINLYIVFSNKKEIIKKPETKHVYVTWLDIYTRMLCITCTTQLALLTSHRTRTSHTAIFMAIWEKHRKKKKFFYASDIVAANCRD